MKRVAVISVSPVKGFRLSHPERVTLTEDGVAENRLFFLAGADGQRLRSSLTAWPTRVRAEYDPAAELLRMSFPDGVGQARIGVGGPVDRCAVTTRDPDTGERDLDTLRLIDDYRGRRPSDGVVLFGVYATVERPGVVAVGDPLEPVA